MSPYYLSNVILKSKLSILKYRIQSPHKTAFFTAWRTRCIKVHTNDVTDGLGMYCGISSTSSSLSTMDSLASISSTSLLRIFRFLIVGVWRLTKFLKGFSKELTAKAWLITTEFSSTKLLFLANNCPSLMDNLDILDCKIISHQCYMLYSHYGT